MPKFLFDHLEASLPTLVHQWANDERVRDIFSLHNIEVSFFETHFAGRVIQYLINVYRGKEKIGNCPVLIIMLEFFKKHKIRLSELYSICMALRLTIVDEMFENNLANQDNYGILVHIMDRNFEGVIEEYIAMCYSSSALEGPIPPKETFQSFSNEPLRPNEEEIEFIEFGFEGNATDPKTDLPAISAKAFLEKASLDTDDIMALREIEEEIKEHVRATDYTKDLISDVIRISDYFKKYGHTILYLDEFSKLSQALMRMGNIFIEKDISSINTDSIAILPMLYEALVNDLSKWRIDIFISKSAMNIHFLDASIIASSEQCLAFLEAPDGTEDEGIIFL